MGGLKNIGRTISKPPTPVPVAPGLLISQKEAQLSGGTVHKTFVKRASLIGGK